MLESGLRKESTYLFYIIYLMVIWIIENNLSFIWRIVFKFDSQKLHIEIFNIINIFYEI